MELCLLDYLIYYLLCKRIHSVSDIFLYHEFANKLSSYTYSPINSISDFKSVLLHWYTKYYIIPNLVFMKAVTVKSTFFNYIETVQKIKGQKI